MELCVKAKAALAERNINARVVSMPCIEEFENQTETYKESVLPAAVKARVCVEAGSPYSWYKYAGTDGEIVGMTTFGRFRPRRAAVRKVSASPRKTSSKRALSSIAKAGK